MGDGVGRPDDASAGDQAADLFDAVEVGAVLVGADVGGDVGDRRRLIVAFAFLWPGVGFAFEGRRHGQGQFRPNRTTPEVTKVVRPESRDPGCPPRRTPRPAITQKREPVRCGTAREHVIRRFAGGNVLQLVSFKVGNEEFGLEILKVQEIIRLRELTRVPNMPDFVDGVINLRGKVIPVIGLRRRMGIAAGEADKRTRIVVAEVNGRVLGFVVDEVSEVLRISADTVQPAPKLGQVEREYVHGIGKIDERLLILIDFNPLITDAEHGQIAAVEQQAAEAL